MPPSASVTPFSCATLTASVACVPRPTLTIWRSKPAVPTDTVWSRLASEYEPSASESVPRAAEL
ncbi:hypothetical protein A8E81_27870 [Burkholderia cenocepacia]|nr:hypothetical protein A8E75_34745 [Burkholderia cenocepacia]ONV14955.1 hypothetical protein A8E74_30740 [Burkholderia cenocepacia]ONV30058.1 hypothetical protein A8E77_21715 [Burkholderia cenocepacia]ONV33150.1 hypothetical protein A8E78_12525 [Burkholderia cenocepacia]ONV37132.1 hypothetical protein A8E82_27115 [Burkholderia cenocepacia]